MNMIRSALLVAFSLITAGCSGSSTSGNGGTTGDDQNVKSSAPTDALGGKAFSRSTVLPEDSAPPEAERLDCNFHILDTIRFESTKKTQFFEAKITPCTEFRDGKAASTGKVAVTVQGNYVVEDPATKQPLPAYAGGDALIDLLDSERVSIALLKINLTGQTLTLTATGIPNSSDAPAISFAPGAPSGN
jgi:hypothetical protein